MKNVFDRTPIYVIKKTDLGLEGTYVLNYYL